jgi:hypothetical protein
MVVNVPPSQDQTQRVPRTQVQCQAQCQAQTAGQAPQPQPQAQAASGGQADQPRQYAHRFDCRIMGRDVTIATQAWEHQKLVSLLRSGAAMTPQAPFVDSFAVTRRGQLRLGAEAERIFTLPNAGGKSIVSEVLSMEYMVRAFGASTVVSEMEIRYWSDNWKKVRSDTGLLHREHQGH